MGSLRVVDEVLVLLVFGVNWHTRERKVRAHAELPRPLAARSVTPLVDGTHQVALANEALKHRVFSLRVILDIEVRIQVQSGRRGSSTGGPTLGLINVQT